MEIINDMETETKPKKIRKCEDCKGYMREYMREYRSKNLGAQRKRELEKHYFYKYPGFLTDEEREKFKDNLGQYLKIKEVLFEMAIKNPEAVLYVAENFV